MQIDIDEAAEDLDHLNARAMMSGSAGQMQGSAGYGSPEHFA